MLLFIGQSEDLNIMHMCYRAVLIFFIALILIRISGRRSFGLRTPLDNIIVILLGAVLSRAIVGASPFAHVIIASLVLVTLHRLFGWFMIHHKKLRHFIEGDKILLYENGAFIEENMKRALLSEEDVMQGVRRCTNTNDLKNVETVYMERNGEISITMKCS